MAITLQPEVQWTSPAPLWQGLSNGQNGSREAFRQPSILRFTTDSFMDEFAAVLNNQPWRLGDWHAGPEAWWSPLPEPARISNETRELPPRARTFKRAREIRLLSAALNQVYDSADDFELDIPDTLKLFQPAHQRFYLISACLVCQIPGLPDRMINVGASERVAFVVRRLRPKSLAANQAYPIPDADYADQFDEYAFTNGANGLEWVQIDDDQRGEVIEGEELNPMFGFSYAEIDSRRRRLLSGLIPVAKREAYLAAHADPINPDVATLNSSSLAPAQEAKLRARMGAWNEKVAGPWRGLIDMHRVRIAGFQKMVNQALEAEAAPNLSTAIIDLDDHVKMMSWYLLLDFAEYLQKYLPTVWAAIQAEDPAGLKTAERALYDDLALVRFDKSGSTRYDICKLTNPASSPDLSAPAPPNPPTSNAVSLFEAITEVFTKRVDLEGASQSYPEDPNADWPLIDFPLITMTMQGLVNGPDPAEYDDYCHPVTSPFSGTLDDLIEAALKENLDLSLRTPPMPLAAKLAKMDSGEPAWFVIRCVFHRPNCGPLKPTVVSDPTRPFQLAAFFEPEAPARPIRIAMPVDTSPAGLRKFAKNTGFVMSNILCGQVNKFKKLGFIDLVLHVLPWPFHKDLDIGSTGMEPCKEGELDIGMICSLSIPIVTIVALILLFIFVSLLDFVFKWLPFLIVCFPLPKFKAKGAPA